MAMAVRVFIDAFPNILDQWQQIMDEGTATASR